MALAMSRRLAAALLAVLFTLAGWSGPAGAHVPSPRVLAYYAEDYANDQRAAQALPAASGQIDWLASFQVRIDGEGRLTNVAPRYLPAWRRKQTLLLVHNLTSRGFERDVATRLLSSPANRREAVRRLSALVRNGGYAGLNVDLENVPPRLRDYYTAWVKELAAELRPKGKLLTLSVPAKTADDWQNAWSGGFDYGAIGQFADYVAIMAYDEYHPGSQPGPVASADWVRRVLDYAVARMPRSKILLGLGTYGFDWERPGSARLVSYREALETAYRTGARIEWDKAASVPHYRYWKYGQVRRVYFESPESARVKLGLAKRYGVAGVAVWRLGLDDARFWQEIGRGLGR